MNSTQKHILIRVVLISSFLMVIYLLLLTYVQSKVSDNRFFEVILLISTIYVALIIALWIRERNLFYDFVMERRINAGNSEYLLCPYCQTIQMKGLDHCQSCQAEWILCQVCKVPFEPGSKILISPCCGLGFHYDHFETAIRENGRCPFCNSDLAVQTSNW